LLIFKYILVITWKNKKKDIPKKESPYTFVKKKLKMKKITLNTLLFSLLVCCSFLFVVSCTEDNIEVVKHNVSVDELLLDENFIAISESMNSYAMFIKSTMEEKGLSPAEILPQIDAINNAPVDEHFQGKLNAIFKTDLTQEIANKNNIVSTNWAVLDSKYNGLNEELLSEAFVKYFETEIGVNSGARGCSWKYGVCVAAHGSGSFFCVAGCTGLSAGIGTPFCVALCSSIAIYGLVVCYDDYCY
jgi:hypothetical protein